MPAATRAASIDIDDAKIALLTADLSSAPTYAASVDVPNVVELNFQFQMKTALLEGDSVVDAVYSKITHATGTISFRAAALDLDANLLGGTMTQTGTTPNQITTLDILGSSLAQYFKVEGRATHVEGIDGVATGDRVTVWKAKVTTGPTTTRSGDFVITEYGFTAVRARSNNKLVSKVLEETKTALT